MLATGALTVVATPLRGQPAVIAQPPCSERPWSLFAVLLLGAKLLLARPAPVRALWPGAVLGAAAVTVVLTAGAPLLARLVAKAGPVYGSFATVAGMFALLYLVGQALVYAAEVAAVRYARLWPRALDLNRPTAADVRALTLLAREQERVPAARVDFHLAAPVPSGSASPDDGPGNPAIQLRAPAASTGTRTRRSSRCATSSRSCSGSSVRTGCGLPRVIGLCWRRCCTGSRGTFSRDCTWWYARIPCSAGTAMRSRAGTPSGPGPGARAGHAPCAQFASWCCG